MAPTLARLSHLTARQPLPAPGDDADVMREQMAEQRGAGSAGAIPGGWRWRTGWEQRLLGSRPGPKVCSRRPS